MEKPKTPYDRLQAEINNRYPDKYRLVPEATVNGWVKMELHKDPNVVRGGRPKNFYANYKAFKLEKEHTEFFKKGILNDYYDFKYDDEHVLSTTDEVYHDIQCTFSDRFEIIVIYYLGTGYTHYGARGFNWNYVFVEEIPPPTQGGKSQRRRRKRRVSRKNRRSRKR